MYGFEHALKRVKMGKKMTRIGWNGEGQYIEIGYKITYTRPDGMIDECDYAIVFHGNSGVQVGWLASQADMLAEDWVEID